MPNRCFVQSCPSGKTLTKNNHYFSPPKDQEDFKKWSLACNLDGRQLTMASKICHLHFPEHKIIKDNSVLFPNGTKHTVPLMRWRLQPHCVPSVFGKVSHRITLPKPSPQVDIPAPKAYDCFSGVHGHLRTPIMITKSVGGASECQMIVEPDEEMSDELIDELTIVEESLLATSSGVGNQFKGQTNWKNKAGAFLKLYNRWKTKYYRLSKQFRRMKEKSIRDGVFIPFTNLNSQEKVFAAALAKRSTVKNLKSMRYTKEQMTESLLLSSKGRKQYEFIRKNSIPILPSFRTLNRLKNGKSHVKRGLNMDVLGYMKDLFKDFEEKDRFVIIKFDEVYFNNGQEVEAQPDLIAEGENQQLDKPLQSSLQSKTLVVLAESVTDKGMFLVANYPSAKGLIGKVIANKLTEVIAALEKHGCAVLAVTSDATPTNKRAYVQFGIQINKGALSKYCIPNVHCPSRCIYFLHNAPHLIHCTKNHFLKGNVSHYFMGKVVSATYIHRLLFLEEKNPMHRVCPELTANHLQVEQSYEKMKENLATQLFSHSTADGIRYYRELGDRQMQDSEVTERFIRFVSDMFSSLNATNPRNAVRNEEKSLLEIMCQSHTILTSSLKSTFALSSTLTSLQLTLKSAFEICNYLLKEKQLDFVLTAKLNLDAVGILFGSGHGNSQNVQPDIDQV